MIDAEGSIFVKDCVLVGDDDDRQCCEIHEMGTNVVLLSAFSGEPC